MSHHANGPVGLRMRMWPRALFLGPVLALVLGSAAQAGNAVTVRIDNFTFAPDAVVVAPGTEVTWINGDDIPHTVVAQDKSFRSRTLDTDDRYARIFDVPGEYPYFCSLHPHMTGKIVVESPGR